MTSARFVVDPEAVVAPVRRWLFGSFVEHMGRCVYTGIYEPGHPSAGRDGFRADVLALTRELGVTVVRYPGGNFVSGYRWEDGVGPRHERPRRRDVAWHSLETNEFGVDDFAAWARQAGVDILMAVNLGTRGVQEALDLQEYLNHPEGTLLADLRRAHASEQPYGVRAWCLGNEMDGRWQLGYKDATEYGRLAAQTARAMRAAEPGLLLVACGSSNSRMPTFAAWEAEVLTHAYDEVDLISCHAYYEPYDGDDASFLASAVDMDHFVDSVVATADAVRARLRRTKYINLAFDEWNVWRESVHHARERPTGWEQAPRLIEEQYDVMDAVVVGSLLISLLRHADRVSAACMAQLVNVIAPIRTEPRGPAWRQTTFHPFALTARHARGDVLRLDVQAPTIPTPRHGPVAAVDAVATHDDGDTSVFLVNRDQGAAMPVQIKLRGFAGEQRLVEALVVDDDDVRATNTADDPDRVVPRPLDGATLADGIVSATLPPVSWTMLRLSGRR